MSNPEVAPCLFVIVGATGDLTRRKLIPALFRLKTRNLLPENFAILGAARSSEMNDETFRAEARQALAEAKVPEGELQAWCDRCLHYTSLGKSEAEDFRNLSAAIAKIEQEHNLPGNRAFYLAQPPVAFPGTITGLGEAGLNRGPGWTRIVIEKPFGRSLSSAKELNHLLFNYFDEPQIFRIDHYLGKETVQNLFVFRFANPIFEALWNRDRVERVQITVAETVGMEGRGAYYEESGVIRDMIQNHLTQLLAVVAMEVPPTFSAQAIRNEKKKVLDSIEPIDPQEVVYGQYIEGLVDGVAVPGYRREPKVSSISKVPTYAALKLEIANWRWHGVPFLLRTGKRLRKRLTEIVVTFRRPPVALFGPMDGYQIHANVLVITIQPDEGFDLHFEVKVPGAGIAVERKPLRFRYGDEFPNLPEAYETLLLDFLTGDQTLYLRSDLVETSWSLYEPLLYKSLEVQPYSSGTWGPTAADLLMAKHGGKWFSR